jgi:hypothetical protein
MVLGLAALAASVVPALRASGISPAGALRAELRFVGVVLRTSATATSAQLRASHGPLVARI